MMNLAFVEKAISSQGTVLHNAATSLKKIQLISVSGAVSCEFRDGGPSGTLKGVLSCPATGSADMVECKENECLTFATNVYIVMSGSGRAGAYLMRI